MKNKRKIRLTKTGKIFVGIIALGLISISMIFNKTKREFYVKEETDDYLIKINYPKLDNKNLVAFADDYVQDKKQEFINDIKEVETDSDFKYEFTSDYNITQMEDTIGVHMIIYEYTGGAHYIRYDKSYYYNEEDDCLVTIMDFLDNEKSLDKLANLAYYYVMKYSDESNLGFDKDMAKSGLEADSNNFEYFNFIDEGLELMFPPYQVAYYAAGEVKIVIPYSELKGVLKDKYLKRGDSDSNSISKTRNLKEFSNKKLIAFTFDDGPSYISTNKLLDNLDKYDARVTFFVVGNRVNNYKDTLKRAYDMGNLIGSHTYSHKNLLKLDDYEVINEIRKTNEVIEEVTGSKTIYLRPPYGNINSKIKDITNMYTILWDLDTEDWKYKNKEKIADYIVSHAHDGAIVLLHDLYETSVDGALLAMEKLEKEGYAFVTIEEMAILKSKELKIDKNYYQL